MATTEYSTQWTAHYITEPLQKSNASVDHGSVRRAYASYTATGAVTINSVINFFKLPKGATVVGGNVVSSDLGTAGDIEIGWDGGTNSLETADANGLFALDVNAAAINTRSDATTYFLLATGWNKTFADEVSIQGDVTEATTAAGTIELEIFYILD